MEGPVQVKQLELGDMIYMSADELRQQVESLGKETKGLTSYSGKRCIAKSVSPKKSSEEGCYVM